MQSPGTQMLMPPEGIPIKDTGRVGAYIKAVSGKARQWIATAAQIKAAATKAEEELRATPLTSAEYVGATARYITAAPTSSAYKSAVAGTSAVLYRAVDGWRLIDAKCIARMPTERSSVEVQFTDEQKTAMAAVSLYRATGERIDG